MYMSRLRSQPLNSYPFSFLKPKKIDYTNATQNSILDLKKNKREWALAVERSMYRNMAKYEKIR